jgi:L-ascorbate metabolism protein UlaG (beta-lactamase superfamily)
VSGVKVTWHGHATVTIEDSGTTLLTDPVLRDRLAHLWRRRGPTPRLDAAPDGVLISHLHPDHCDVVSLRSLPRTTRFVVPRGASAYLRRKVGDRDWVELTSGEQTTVGGLTVRAVPASHDGGRSPGSRARAEAVGYLVSGERTAWFAGDTGLYDGMSRLGPVDLALLPVWGWSWTIGAGHLDPWGAAEAARRAAAGWAVPIHWGTLWPVGCKSVRPDRFTEPGNEFARFAADRTPGTAVRVLAPGGSLALSRRRSLTPSSAPVSPAIPPQAVPLTAARR